MLKGVFAIAVLLFLLAFLLWMKRLHRKAFADFITMQALEGKNCRIEDIFMCRDCGAVNHFEDLAVGRVKQCPKCGNAGIKDGFIPATRYINAHNS